MMLASSEASPALSRHVLLECLRDFAHVRLTVSGACMEPALRDGDVVTLVAASRRRPRLGDVVLALVGDGFQLHRLVWAPPRGRWRIKADRAPTWDAAVNEPDLIATAVEVQSGERTRRTRSARRLLKSLLAVAVAHLRARRRPPSGG
jgi:Peptidase S24-like